MRMDADREEMRVSWEREERQKGWLKKCPFCTVCDERITDHKCYVFDNSQPMQTCICESCFEGQIELLQKVNLAVVFREDIEEKYIYGEYWRETPHGEEF